MYSFLVAAIKKKKCDLLTLTKMLSLEKFFFFSGEVILQTSSLSNLLH